MLIRKCQIHNDGFSIILRNLRPLPRKRLQTLKSIHAANQNEQLLSQLKNRKSKSNDDYLEILN